MGSSLLPLGLFAKRTGISMQNMDDAKQHTASQAIDYLKIVYGFELEDNN
ncbi:hypothetical protein MANES_14G156150v8 [Manihot esculenta]|uniref:Uncharacterized protein n=1 Tax=Manihot esculenta TaxID=3983 RepID=A0ACB7GH69_MANES|nr:hypothetical protein MANES_14G156150v8 [Manihot esculenta]